MGHKNTIFNGLENIAPGDLIEFSGERYRVAEIEVAAKEEINMAEILADEAEKTLILMTCAGEALGGDDYSHRLIVAARKDRE